MMALPDKSGVSLGDGQYRNAVVSNESSASDIVWELMHHVRPDATALTVSNSDLLRQSCGLRGTASNDALKDGTVVINQIEYADGSVWKKGGWNYRLPPVVCGS
jgi:hypothetical protein